MNIGYSHKHLGKIVEPFIYVISLLFCNHFIFQQFHHSLVLAGILSQPDNLEHPCVDVDVDTVDGIRHLTFFIGIYNCLCVLIRKITNPGA